MPALHVALQFSAEEREEGTLILILFTEGTNHFVWLTFFWVCTLRRDNKNGTTGPAVVVISQKSQFWEPSYDYATKHGPFIQAICFNAFHWIQSVVVVIPPNESIFPPLISNHKSYTKTIQ